AVPALSRVEPVSTSGPTLGAITIVANRAIGMRVLDVTATVIAPRLRAYRKALSTYGVVPLAAIPTTMSFLVRAILRRSLAPFAVESSAPSTAPAMARLPPAISAITSRFETPKVGGHSAASRIARRPLDPAPT